MYLPINRLYEYTIFRRYDSKSAKRFLFKQTKIL